MTESGGTDYGLNPVIQVLKLTFSSFFMFHDDMAAKLRKTYKYIIKTIFCFFLNRILKSSNGTKMRVLLNIRIQRQY